METKLAHVNEKKKVEVENIKKLIRENPVLAVIDLECLPAAHFLKIRYKLRDKIFIKTTKKRLIKIAFDQLEKEKPEITKLKDMLKGIPALLFSKEDEFKLQKLLNKNKTAAFAKAGQVAKDDIYVKAGPTNFGPGPMIGEFGQLGIKTQVLENKINIREDRLLVKEGEVINEKVANILSKLGIEPMDIGLNLIFTYKNGEIFVRKDLDVNEDEYLNNLRQCSAEALNLAVGVDYITKDIIEILLKKAQINSIALNNKVGDLDSVSAGEPFLEKASEKNEEKETVLEKNLNKNEEQTSEKNSVENTENIGQELKQDILLQELNKTKEKDINIEVKSVKTDKDEMKKAADILKELTDKKIRGEI